MASISKRGKSGFHTLIYRDRHGVRHKEATKIADPKKAQALADELEAASRVVPAEVLASDVEAMISRALKAAGVTVGHSRLPWGEFSSEFRDQCTDSVRKKYDPKIRRFGEWIGTEDDMNGITPARVEKFRDHLSNLGLGSNSVNSELSMLRRIFQRAFDFGLIDRNPVNVVKRVEPVEDVDEQFSEPFTPSEYQKLLDYFGAKGGAEYEEWTTATMLAYHIGSRLKDTVRMSWDAIDLENLAIDYIPSKTRKSGRKSGSSRVRFPLDGCPDLVARLESLSDRSGYLLPVLQARALPKLSTKYVEMIPEAGVKVTRVERDGIGRGRQSHTFHSLRHSAISNAAKAGIPVEIRKALFGHSSVEMNEHYTHYEMETLRAAVQR